ncbi:hypothetical protein F5Y17DRAFT_450919 [Xylariaceae sp. FL0594]|nr:hypothetical protein F5Y17DRAFT_450919 [Xylariaceae sp. FL0594]
MEVRSIEYHTLIVATGSRYRGNTPWKEAETTAQTLSNLAKLREDIRQARSIIVAGAGPTGVEFAAELGHAYGKTGKKEIKLVGTEEDLPLSPQVKTSVREAAKRQLERLRVEYIGGVRATKRPATPAVAVAIAAGGSSSNILNNKGKMTPTTTRTTTPLSQKNDEGGGGGGAPQGKQTVTLKKPNGETRTLTADLLVKAYGMIPNTFFAPDRMRNDMTGGHMRQDQDLRTPGYDNIFVLGDVGDLQPPQAAHTDAQVRHLMKQLTAYFDGLPIKPYVFEPDKVQLALSLGRDHGTGQAGHWQIWGYIIWYFKSRHLGTDQAAAYAKGKVGGLGRPWPNNI